ncbi:hypothetical protein V865_005903 [Kwoniella europaea PYCC6329]|uniref:TraD/TraG TraM recognition site domain-containing protein n=1 Tax=Kwoniella europaea PYCC6329 TaxID=1423913 RepID=A0AAX4KPA7_9TREE
MGQSVFISQSVEQLFKGKTDDCSSAIAHVNRDYELWCNQVTVTYESTNGLIGCRNALHTQAAPPYITIVKPINSEGNIKSLERFPEKYREALAEIQHSGVWRSYCEGCEAEGHAPLALGSGHTSIVGPYFQETTSDRVEAEYNLAMTSDRWNRKKK